MKIIIVDDHTMLRDSLALLLQEHFNHGLILLHAADGCSALKQVASHADIDLVLLDIDLPDMHGFQVIKQLQEINPCIRILAISGTVTQPFIRQCLELGTVGFVPKTSTGQVTLAAIDLALSGGIYIPTAAMDNEKSYISDTIPSLTSRQIDVLQLIRQGMSNDEIASMLGISTATVKSHVRGIFSSLEVKNRTEAVNEALLLHLL